MKNKNKKPAYKTVKLQLRGKDIEIYSDGTTKNTEILINGVKLERVRGYTISHTAGENMKLDIHYCV